jgi:hypothetical protein
MYNISMKKNIKTNNNSIVYQANNGGIELKGDIKHEMIWSTQEQICNLFESSKSNLSRHIKNIIDSNELNHYRTVAFFATVQKEGSKN